MGFGGGGGFGFLAASGAARRVRTMRTSECALLMALLLREEPPLGMPCARSPLSSDTAARHSGEADSTILTESVIAESGCLYAPVHGGLPEARWTSRR